MLQFSGYTHDEPSDGTRRAGDRATDGRVATPESGTAWLHERCGFVSLCTSGVLLVWAGQFNNHHYLILHLGY